ncbi:glycosyltransferase [Candidatus Enterococcus mansonii]|uniref:Glycosyltransferase 2-like domain-containing protein n=1 Tax=Candidatus Enterococcus mansonii TaxID=1834181 RepID=A0ABU8IG42_9ENTE
MISPSISIGIMCKNEEKTISRCLEAIQRQINDIDEVIVVDTGSTDQTINIIKKNFPKIGLYYKQWDDNFSEIRNFIITLSKKDWIFFIDSDEIIQPSGLINIRNNILKIEKVSNDAIVFCPKVLNTNDSIVYNTGRIIKNNGLYKFFGYVHEYPIYKNNLNADNLTTVILEDVVMIHDGYEDNTMTEKNKSKRNTILNEKMLTEFPDNDRYYYFYCRDAKPLLSQEEYELSLSSFFDIYPTSRFTNEAYLDLISCLIEQGKTQKAEIYIKKYWEEFNTKETFSKSGLVYLTVLNEIQKIMDTQKELLEVMINTKKNIQHDSYRTVENGYNFEDIIGFLYWSLGDIPSAILIKEELNTTGYKGMLNELFQLLNWNDGDKNEI